VRRRLEAADTIVWVDLPLRTHLWRALRRQLVQGERRPTWLMLKTIVRVHRRFRPRWEVEFVTNRHKLVRLRSPGALRQFLEDSRAEG
jgi:adenylate kinase family enzyme